MIEKRYSALVSPKSIVLSSSSYLSLSISSFYDEAVPVPVPGMPCVSHST
jgi:hypothetical protein